LKKGKKYPMKEKYNHNIELIKKVYKNNTVN